MYSHQYSTQKPSQNIPFYLSAKHHLHQNRAVASYSNLDFSLAKDWEGTETSPARCDEKGSIELGIISILMVGQSQRPLVVYLKMLTKGPRELECIVHHPVRTSDG